MWSKLAVAVAASALTLTAATAQAEPKQGGEMVVTYKDDISTFDPAIGYDWQNWSMIKSLFDGLMDYEPGTTNLRPELAESYEISPDGKTFTFKLRPGAKFASGNPVTAEDVVWSLKRLMKLNLAQRNLSLLPGIDISASRRHRTISSLTEESSRSLWVL
mgnify:CR=1 FL=1